MMTLSNTIELGATLRDHISAHLPGIWPGYAVTPFMLYNDAFQVAVGDQWPSRFQEAQPGIFVAQGTDPQLMGSTALMYDNRMIAIWDTRSWSNTPDTAIAAGGIAHEMFHAYQMAHQWHYSNDAILCAYPHSTESTTLVLAENTLLADTLHANDADLRILLTQLARLRTQRTVMIGDVYMEYDMRVESMEGTAAFVEICMQAAVSGQTHAICGQRYADMLQKTDDLLKRYRHRCYAAGLMLCLAADRLVPDWRSCWNGTMSPLFTWLMDETHINAAETNEALIPLQQLQQASVLVNAYRQENQAALDEYITQPTITLEGNLALTGFDPMNIVCVGNRCLHIHGRVRLGDQAFLLEQPFMEVFDSTVFTPRSFIMRGSVTVVDATHFTVDGLGTFAGTVTENESGPLCRIV